MYNMNYTNQEIIGIYEEHVDNNKLTLERKRSEQGVPVSRRHHDLLRDVGTELFAGPVSRRNTRIAEALARCVEHPFTGG